jgi:cobalt/nickel transport system ATP-binding protein
MARKAVEICHLSYTYPDGTTALKDISLDIWEGETLGLIGSNGAGKSTLLLHLNGILMGNSPVKIGEIPVTADHLPLIRSRVGMIFQDPDHQLFRPTVWDDVSFGPINMGMSAQDINDTVQNALKKVDALPLRERSSHHLSVGEKKRVSLATVLSMNPRIIVLDEPSSNLDPRHRLELIELLHGLALTKIIASHDITMIEETCDRVAVMSKGEICGIGRTNDILSDEELLRKHDLLYSTRKSGELWKN